MIEYIFTVFRFVLYTTGKMLRPPAV